MKITCPYCNNLFNDTLEKCPNCGAPNSGVVRKSGSQPITIEDLKNWYASKGLPPYETTRFFIGENYKKPRAFGIYQDEQSKEFIVYKNKNSGERVIRYRGSDEAYAVNELYQRLKQEIIQQKRANLQKSNPAPKKATHTKTGPRWGLIIGLSFPAFFLFFILLGLVALIVQDLPKNGYYLYEQALYYHYDYIQPDEHSDWFWYDSTDGWLGPMRTDVVPNSLQKNKNAKAYYLSETLPTSRTEPDFLASVVYQDITSGHKSNTGYYKYQDYTYYHLDDDLYSGWYYYDSDNRDWYESDYDDIPYELQHSTTSEDFFYTPTWDSSTQITDFTDTDIYSNYLEEQEKLKSNDDDDSWDDDDYWDDDDSWDSNDSWDSYDSDWDSDW